MKQATREGLIKARCALNALRVLFEASGMCRVCITLESAICAIVDALDEDNEAKGGARDE